MRAVGDGGSDHARAQIKLLVCRKRSEFANPNFKFTDRDAHETILECRRFKDATYDLRRLEMDVGLEALPDVVTESTQTPWFRTVNNAVQYEPVPMTAAEVQATEGAEDFSEFLDSVRDRCVLARVCARFLLFCLVIGERGVWRLGTFA